MQKATQKTVYLNLLELKNNMPKYSVKRYWEMCDSVEVDALSIEDAITKACDLPLSNKPEYVTDSMNVDEDIDVVELTHSYEEV